MKIHNDDLALYEKCRNGDSDAIGEVIKIYSDTLIMFINGFVCNIGAAEELMEDSVCDMVMSKHRYRGKSSLKTYLFAIGKNKALDYLRRNAKHGADPIEDHEMYLHDMNSLEDMVIKDDRHRELWRAMEQLSDIYRTLLYLLYFEDMSYAEVSKVLGRSVGQIKSLAYRARVALKAELMKGGFVYEEL